MSSSTKAGLAAQEPPASWLTDGEGRRLAFSAYPAPEPRLHLLISHGFAEHRGWWHHAACAFQEAGISTYTFDHFHHGRSDGKPGDAPTYEVLVAGLRLALEQGVTPLMEPGAQLTVLGHSNGGLAVLRALPVLPPGRVGAVVLSNPLLRLPPRLSVLGFAVGWLLQWVAPGLMVPSPLRPWRLTSDRSLWPAFRSDPLRFRRVSVRFFLELVRTSRKARREADCLGLPLLLLLSGKDRVVDSAATRAWFDRLECPGKRLIPHPGLRHEIFNEPSWREAVGEVAAWLKAQAAPDVAGRTPAPGRKGDGLP